ncbi:MAG: hypothetical protein HY012_02295 [Acidobacteria bacterium]|nr:hypothetical protein [Acidobacteriota bacterium]
MPATRRLILIIIVLLLLLLFLVVPGVSWSQTPQNPWQEPARELAKKVVAISGPRQTVTLAVRNISSLSDSEAAAVRLALEGELRAAGLRLAAKPDSAPGDPQRLLVLEPTRLSLYQADKDRLKLQQSVPLPTLTNPARDPRGYLVLRDDHFLLSLAGNLCRGVADQMLNVACWDMYQDVPRQYVEEMHWLELSIVPGRNYFRQRFRVEGSDEQRESLFSSAAGWVEGGEPLRFDVSVDGVVRLYRLNADRAPAARFSGWGSQVSGISSNCGRERQLLVTRPGDWTEFDVVQAFDIIGTKAVAVSSPLDFHGPVKELWPGKSPHTALAIVLNLKTNHYEAYTLTLSCGR